MSRIRERYGASPLHLLGHLVVFAITLWAISHVFDGREPWNFVVWFVAAALLHDLLLLPFYSVLDRVAQALPGPRSAVNFVRVPALMSGVMLLVYFPRILDRAPGNYTRVSGFDPEGYMRNWLLITAALFMASALLYVGRSAAARRRSR
ncbi:MAG: hypothetical protein ABI950_01660 [Solirubrobacteraceae bacterium]